MLQVEAAQGVDHDNFSFVAGSVQSLKRWEDSPSLAPYLRRKAKQMYKGRAEEES